MWVSHFASGYTSTSQVFKWLQPQWIYQYQTSFQMTNLSWQLDCNHRRLLARSTQVIYSQIHDPQKLCEISVCCLKSLNLGIFCEAAILNPSSKREDCSQYMLSSYMIPKHFLPRPHFDSWKNTCSSFFNHNMWIHFMNLPQFYVFWELVVILFSFFFPSLLIFPLPSLEHF